eukprot:102583_1
MSTSFVLPIPGQVNDRVDSSRSVSSDKTNDADAMSSSGHSDTPESYLEPVDYKFDIFIEYTLHSQKIVDGYIRNRNINRAFSLLSVIPHSVRTLIFKYYFIRKQNEVERLSFVGHFVFSGHMTMQEVKKRICDRFGSKVPCPSKRMRIRHIYNKQHIDFVDELLADGWVHQPLINIVYYDDETLGANCNRIRHENKMEICCQQLESTEIFTQRHILLRCFRCFKVESMEDGPFGWYLTTQWKMDDFVEIVFEREDHADDIKTKLCEQIANDIHPNNMWLKIQKFNRFDKVSFVKELKGNLKNGGTLLPAVDHYPLDGHYVDCDVLIFIDKQELKHSGVITYARI